MRSLSKSVGLRLTWWLGKRLRECLLYRTIWVTLRAEWFEGAPAICSGWRPGPVSGLAAWASEPQDKGDHTQSTGTVCGRKPWPLAVGQGVFELKIYWGPGYRVYFGCDGPHIIILLIGGEKSTQTRDIHEAQNFWQDYQWRNHGTKH
ncbi:MAG: type II toxin-antitoxin system RelE/ParE family toxin [Elusimicrobiota bacterium]